MSNKTEENTNIQYKNLDIELENAINLANESMQTVGERLLFVYNLARQKGYDPFESRKIVETRIINISPSYLRKMLPIEAKHTEKQRFAPQVAQKSKPITSIIEEDDDEETEKDLFWVDFFVKIGTGGITFNLLIDPNKRKVLEYKRK